MINVNFLNEALTDTRQIWPFWSGEFSRVSSRAINKHLVILNFRLAEIDINYYMPLNKVLNVIRV